LQDTRKSKKERERERAPSKKVSVRVIFGESMQINFISHHQISYKLQQGMFAPLSSDKNIFRHEVSFN
jgi:hypothetical protein